MKKKIFRMTSVFLCLVILLQTLPLAVFAVETGAEAPAAAESSEQSLAPTASTPSEGTSEPTVLGEVEEMREPNQKTFRMSDGTYRRAIYPYDVHYEGDSGALLDIDNSLTSGTAGGEDVLANGANSSTVRFFKKSSGEKFYSMENGKNKVTVSIAGAAKADAVFENTPDGSGHPMALTDLSGSVRYEEIFPDVDVEYILVSKRVKENVIIKERGTLSSLTYTYSFNGGVTAVQENDRKIAVYEKRSQTLLFTVTAPALWDSQGGYSDALTLTLTEAKNSKITLRLDFTVGEEMTYPVTVDPVLQFQAERNDIQDTHIIASNPTANYNANNHIRIRNDGYALLQFPTPSLRPGDKIVGAQVALFPYGYFDSTPGYSNTNSYNPTLKLTAHRITRAWNEKTVTYQSADPANGFYDPTAEDYFPVVSNDSFYSWDITRLANEWTEGTKTNHGILLKYAAPPSDGSTFDTFFCSTNGAYLQQAVWPQIVYSYINTVGVEDYFSYHTQSLGFSGEGYVNDLTGNLTVARELVTTGGTLAPVSLSLIYNTALATTTASAPYGTGWKLNLAQKVVKLTPPGSSAEYLQYTDADGTHHYFKTDSAGVWVDEIDPDRKLYLNSSNNDMEMKDSGDTTLYFTNRAGFDEWYLYKIVDIYGNYVNVNLDSSNLNRVNSAVSSDGNGVYMDYSDYGFLTAVRYMNTGAVKTVSVQYNSRMTTHNNGVTDIVFPDGSSARYNYHEGTYRLSSALNLDNSSIQYGYHNTSGRVASVREVSSAGTVGNQFTFAYEPTATTVTDVNLGRTYLYTFAANGTLKSAVDTTASDGNGYGQYYEWGGGNTSLTGMGNLTFASKTQKNTVNLLPNHSFEQSGSITGVSYGTDSGTYGFTNEMARVGSRSYKLTAPVSGNYSTIYGYYVLSLPAAEEYTLSAYINTKDLESSSTGGARVVAIIGSEYYYSEVIKEAKDEWQRLSVTFPVTVGQNVSLCVSLSGAKGSIFFDNMQLEVGGLSDYNLLENAGFETDSAWSSYSPAPYTTAHKASGARAAQITSTPDTAYDFLQTLSVPNGKAGDSYVASAFAKATSVPAEGWKFTLLVRFTKSGATVNEQNILFNSHTTAWQKVAGAAKATGDYDAVQFWLLYYNNCNTVYFDNAQLILDTFGTAYTYDAKGNLLTTVDLQGKEENTFTYDGNDQLIRQTNISGGHILYSYDANKKTQLEQVTAGGNTTAYTYDSYGNATSATTHGSTLVPGQYYYLQNVYYSEYVRALPLALVDDFKVNLSSFGKNPYYQFKLIRNEDGSYSFENRISNQRYLLTVESLADLGEVVLQPEDASAYQKFTLEQHYGNIYFLKLKANPNFALDSNGSDCYAYPVNGGFCQQFALIPAGSGTASSPVLSSSAQYSANGAYMTALTDSRGNTTNYAYNTDRGYLLSETDPKGNTTSYTYTLSEQIETVTSGNSTVTYGYNSAKQLSTITTPGGSVYGISYDAFGRKSGVTVGGDSLAAYTYTALGQTETVTYGDGTVTRYTYDDLGRLVQTSINDVPQTKTVYDGSSRVHEQYDLIGERKVKLEYDLLGREVKRSLYDTESGDLLSEVRTSYDDTKNRIAGYTVTSGGVTTSYTYGYGENNESPDAVTSVKVGGTNLIENEYDDLNRLSTRTLNTTPPVETSYTYAQGADAAKTTTLVASMQTGSENLSYAYDANGNITSVSENGAVVESYTYDAKNQLLSITRGTDVWTYIYDDNGNILSVKKNGTDEKTYGYTDSKWKDKLTSFNGSTITYDALGNPLQYRDGIALTWTNGRKLATFTKNNQTFSFAYDGEGNRIRKQGANNTVDYTVIGGVIYAEKRTASVTNELHFLFDENGTRIGFVHNNTDTYYYRFNLQGDVTGIYNSAGYLITEYTYDAWGKSLSVGGPNPLIGMINPIRYRGYYYDMETGLYYLQSRYYDPETCRFINADVLLDTSSVLGFNLYSYCGNNPVNSCDPSGLRCVCLTQRVGPRHVCESTKKAQEAKKIKLQEITKNDDGFRDVTEEVNKVLNLYIIEAQKISLVANAIPAYEPYRYGVFGLLVNHGATWDIKRKEPWETTIGTPYPGFGAIIIYQGMTMTPESLGNYIYGVLGASFGIPYQTLIDGSSFAAYSGKSMYRSEGVSDEMKDWEYIKLGYLHYILSSR